MEASSVEAGHHGKFNWQSFAARKMGKNAEWQFEKVRDKTNIWAFVQIIKNCSS